MADALVARGIELDTGPLAQGRQRAVGEFEQITRAIDRTAQAADRMGRVVAIPTDRLNQVRRFRQEQALAAQSTQSLADIQARAGRDPIYARSTTFMADRLAALRQEQGTAAGATRDLGEETRRAATRFDTFRGSIDQVSRRMVGLVAGYLTFRTALRAGREILQTNIELETLEAQLVTMTGSAGAAARAFQFITDFAVDTPFEIKNLTESFVRLRGFGVEPTAERMRGLGNVAAFAQRDIGTLTDAIISGVNGMARPLRQFTINAAVAGETLQVSFGGVTRTIPRTTEALVDFLVEVAQGERIASAMANRMQTMGGQASNLTDAIDILIGRIGKAGLNAEVTALIREFTTAIRTGNDLAQTLGEGLAGGVNLARESFRELLPLIRLTADLMERFRSEASQIAQPGIDLLGQVDTRGQVGGIIETAARDRLRAVKQLEEANRQLEAVPDAFRTAMPLIGRDVARFYDIWNRLVLPPRFQLQGPAQVLEAFDLDEQIRDAEQRIEAAERVITEGQRRLREISEPGLPPFEVEGLETGLDRGTEKLSEFERAVERLTEGTREIRAMEAAFEGTSLEIDSLTERAQLLDQVISSMAQLDLRPDQARVFNDLLEERLRLERQLTDRAILIEGFRPVPGGPVPDLVLAAEEGERQRQEFEENAKRMEEAAESMANSVAGALGDLITSTQGPAEAFRRMVDAIISEMARLTLVRPIAQFLAGLLSPGIPAAPAEVPRAPDSLIGRQFGGPVDPGRLFVVGESGPELFVPRTAGTILPNETVVGTRGGGTTVHITNRFDFHNIDNRGSRGWAEQQAPMLARVLRKEFKRMGIM